MYHNDEGYSKWVCILKNITFFFEVWSYEIPKLQDTILIMFQKDFGKFEDLTFQCKAPGEI
jgi:hypothetical protein